MEKREDCVRYLEAYYKDLFFGNVNRRYRAMTAAEMRARVEKLTAGNLKRLSKSNELNDIHAMFAKVCSWLLRKEGKLPPGPPLEEWEKNWKRMGFRPFAKRGFGKAGGE